MKLNLSEKNDGMSRFSKKQVALIEEFTAWVIDKFITKRVKNNIEINMVFDSNLFKNHKAAGFSWWLDKQKHSRVFKILIDSSNQPFITILSHIAHELVHVKQFALGEYYHPRDYVKHKDICYYLGKRYDISRVDYWDRPWEIEALGRSTGLVVQWMKECNHEEERWTRANIVN